MSDISSILSQIRSFETQARSMQGLDRTGLGGMQKPGGINPNESTPGVSFGDTLNQAIKKVNSSQAEAGKLRTAFEMGDPKIDLARVMVAQQSASVAFRATVEVRNRLVQAYQDVMNMPL